MFSDFKLGMDAMHLQLPLFLVLSFLFSFFINSPCSKAAQWMAIKCLVVGKASKIVTKSSLTPRSTVKVQGQEIMVTA